MSGALWECLCPAVCAWCLLFALLGVVYVISLACRSPEESQGTTPDKTTGPLMYYI